MGTIPNYDETARAGNLNRDRAIRLKCLDCCAGNANEVRKCHLTKCALHPWRLGALSRTVGEKTRPTPNHLVTLNRGAKTHTGRSELARPIKKSANGTPEHPSTPDAA